MKFQTLDDAFFTRQVPGRYSTWEEEEEEKDHKDDESKKCHDNEEQEDNDGEEKGCNNHKQHYREMTAISSSSPSPHHSGPQTGVKGVLADHRAHQLALYEQRMQERAHRHSVLLRIARGSFSTSSSDNCCCSLPSINEEGEGEDEDDEDDDDDDQTFLQAYRLKRLDELKQERTVPRFGCLQEVSGYKMVDMVNRLQGSPAKVMVHVHEPHLKACRLVNYCLQVLAQKFPEVCFLSLHQGHHLSPSELQLDEAALPLLMLYEGGEVKECWSQLEASLGASFLIEDMEELLAESGVI